MTVYVDDMRASVRFGQNIWKMSHMIADTRDELDEMAEKLQLKPKYKQKVGERQEHFDVTETFRLRAIKLGAKSVTMKELGRILRDRNLEEYLGELKCT